MRNVIISLSLVFFLIGCATDPEQDTNNQVRPVVKKTDFNYTAENFYSYFPDSVTLKSVANAFKNNLNDQTRTELINYIKTEVAGFGGNANTIDTILTRAGCRSELIIPTYIEKAKFNNNEAWIIQYAWGMFNDDIGHYKCLVYNYNSLDTLHEIGCR